MQAILYKLTLILLAYQRMICFCSIREASLHATARMNRGQGYICDWQDVSVPHGKQLDFLKRYWLQNLGVTRGAVSNWERAGGSIPASNRLEKIANITHVSFEWLATGRGHMQHDHLNDIPAVAADLVEDPEERRLLAGYRSAPARTRQQMLQLALAALKR